MTNHVYAITMYSPMGPKEGTLRLRLDEGRCDAEIDLMRHSNHFTALPTGERAYQLKGTLQTSVGGVDCTIDAQIDDTGLSAVANTSKGKMRIDGHTAPE